jgi:glycosyltransferase involved in cell wall biosynthesis
MYNAGRTIGVALASLLWQTYRRLDLLLIDDGSRDDTVAIVSAIRDERIRIVRNERNMGLAWTLNRAIDLARGPLLARMDSDDVAYPERFARQVSFLQHEPDIDLLATRAIAFRNDGEPRGLLPFRADHAAICARPWTTFPMPHPTWMGRIEWFRRYRYRIPEVVRAEDHDLLLRSYSRSRFACLPEVLLGYRQDSYSLARQMRARRHLALAQLRNHFAEGHPGRAVLGGLYQAAKAAADVFAAAPGLSALYYTRVSGDLPDAERAAWAQVWQRATLQAAGGAAEDGAGWE